MSSEVTATIFDFAVIAILVAGSLLLLAIAAGLILLYPTLRRIMANIEVASKNAAESWQNFAEASQSAKEAAADLAILASEAASNAPDVVKNAKEIAENVRVTTSHIAEASRLLAFIGASQDSAAMGLSTLGQFFKKLLGR